MPRMFIKLEDKKNKTAYFFEWSTISDSVNSQVVTEDQFKFMYDQLGYTNYQEDLKNLNETGVSNPHYTLEELLECSDDFTSKRKLMVFCREFVNL